MNSSSIVTIPRSDHLISRSNLSPNAVRVMYRLHDQGFTTYLVGGCVRDLLLGREPKDFDIVTNATPGQIKRLFRNCRLVGRRFRLAHLHFQDEMIEVATFRSMSSGTDAGEDAQGDLPSRDERAPDPRHLKDVEGMILRDNVFGTPEEDARRRDFTVNALFYSIADFSIIDHVGGMTDLQSGILRIIGDPSERFTEDPVRMLRAVRFSALLGFTIEPATSQALLDLSETITRAAPARLYEEILKMFLCGEGSKIWQQLRQTGLLGALFPHFDRWLHAETQNFPHTGPAEALSWIDARIQQGESVTPPLLFALLFRQYIDEKMERHRGNGLPAQQSLDAAVAELMGELAPTVLIPNRIAVGIRAIFSMQRRFYKIPGRHAELFTTRHGFQDAMQFLRFTAENHGTGRKEYEWWQRLANDLPAAPPEENPREQDRPKRRRRRRRRHNPQSDS